MTLPLHQLEPERDLGVDGHEPIGEVIESSTIEFVAQTASLDVAPELGAFVRVSLPDGMKLLGVAAYVETGSIDPSARPIMRGYGSVRDGRIYEENPDLPHVLRTTFRAVLVGFSRGYRYYQHLPPYPPRLHYSVSLCSPVEIRGFTGAGLDYLGTLLRAPNLPNEELVAANVRLAAAVDTSDDPLALRAGRTLSQLLRADYARLAVILRQIEPAWGDPR